MREEHKTSWETFISRVEQDVHGRQEIAYKLMRHYQNLWYDPHKEEIPTINDITETDSIDMTELQHALMKTKN